MRKLEDSLIYFLSASFGSFDVTIFDDAYLPDRPDLHRFGVYFVLLFVFLNLIILVNVVIAMMADTYGYMTTVKIGIYSHSVIKAAPAYTQDKHYGALALLPAPFAAFSFLTLPYYFCVKDKTRLEKFTTRFNMIFYFFVSILISVIFMALNLILMPFAYLKTCYDKVLLARSCIIKAPDVFSYVRFGLFKGILVQFTDFWAFLKTSWQMEKPKRNDKTFVIDRAAFEIFYKIIVNLE